jgi:hypothetical protein
VGQLARTAPAIAERAWTTDRDWREVADALLLIGGIEVVKAAREHIDATQRKLEAAWQAAGIPMRKDAMRTAPADLAEAPLLDRWRRPCWRTWLRGEGRWRAWQS